jgi:hypothetical protein
MDERAGQGPSPVNPRTFLHRRDTIVPETGHDPYRESGRLPEPAICPGCGAAREHGRWAWVQARPAGALEKLCPACRRQRDRQPAGLLELSGPFVLSHRDEVLNLVRNEANAETREHPLNRLMEVTPTAAGVLITTTDVHLPRRLGEALLHAYKGSFQCHYAHDDTAMRASWHR